MKFIDEKIEEYALNKSTRPCSLLKELEKDTHREFDLPQMISGELVASFLQTFIKATKAKRVLELGTFVGYGSLVMAQALPDEGEVVTVDVDTKCVNFAKNYWQRSDHGHKINSIIGSGLEYMNNSHDGFDLIFIDADKKNYLNYFKRGLEILNDGGVIIVDNVLWGGSVLDAKDKREATVAIKEVNDFIQQNNNLHKTLLPIRDGLFIVMKA